MPFDHNVLLRVRVGDDGEADIQTQVRRIEVEDTDRGSDKATIDLDNQAGANGAALRRGMQVRIDMGWETEYTFLFHGRIHATRPLTDSRSTGSLRVTCFDLSCDLSHPPALAGRTHVGTLQEIVTALAADASIPVGGVVIDPMPSWTEAAPLNQTTRSPWQFLQDLAGQHRARAFVEVNGTPGDGDTEPEGEARLYFMSETALLSATPLGRLTKCHGYSDLIEFSVRNVGASASPVGTITVADPDTGQPVTEAAPEPEPDAPAALSDAQARDLTATGGASRADSMEAATDLANAATVQPSASISRATVAGAPSDPARARQRIERDKTRLLGLFGEGMTTGSVFLRAKGSVLIEGIGTGQEGQWYLRKVKHIIERTTVGDQTRSTFRTRFEATR